MNVTVLALQFGGFIFIAIFFGWVLKTMLDERKQDREERATFVKSTLKFSNVIDNHMSDMTKAINQLSDTMEREADRQTERDRMQEIRDERMNERGKIIESVMTKVLKLNGIDDSKE